MSRTTAYRWKRSCKSPCPRSMSQNVTIPIHAELSSPVDSFIRGHGLSLSLSVVPHDLYLLRASRPRRARLPRIDTKVSLAWKPRDSESAPAEDIERERQSYSFTPEGIKVGARLSGKEAERTKRDASAPSTPDRFFSTMMLPRNLGPPPRWPATTTGVFAVFY